MKYVTFQRGGGPAEPGVVVDQRVVSLKGAGFADMLSVIAAGSEGREKDALALFGDRLGGEQPLAGGALQGQVDDSQAAGAGFLPAAGVGAEARTGASVPSGRP